MLPIQMQTHEDCLSGKSVIITGHNGFVGSWLSAALTMIGAHVYGWSHIQRSDLSPWDFLDEPMPNVSSVDITDDTAVCKALRLADADLIVHLAGMTNVGACMKEPQAAFKTNAVGTLHILEAIRTLGLHCKIILASSDAVFGNKETQECLEQGMDEEQPVTFGEPYGTSKSVSELVSSCYQSSYFHDRLMVAIARFANVFGYGDPNEKHVIPQFILAALEKGVVHLKYRLNGRQFLYMTDLIRGILAVCRWLLRADSVESAPTVLGGKLVLKPTVFHFALTEYPNTKEPFVRMNDLAELVCAATHGRVDQTGIVDYASNENKVQALNCAQTENLLGWHPTVSLLDGISLLTDWYRQILIQDSCRRGNLVCLIEKAMKDIEKSLNQIKRREF